MENFKRLSNNQIHKIWSENNWKSKEEIHKFRCELVRRSFVSWDEINTKFICEAI